MTIARETLQTAIDSLGLTIRSEFVPWSRSRNAKQKDRSLNWRVTLVRDGRDVLTTDYSAGIGHCPSYRNIPGSVHSLDKAAAIDLETELGKEQRGKLSLYSGNPILPDTCDVVYSLVQDADVLNHSRFEEWASNLGYNPNSRAAEAIYRTSLEIALALRNSIGDAGLAKLSEACREF
jgi:hypothetical protein